MSDDSKPKIDYSSNSSKSKQQEKDAANRPAVKAVTSGKVRKQSVGSKFKETFAGDDAGSVFQYVLFDVIVPRLKDMLFDTVSQGTERALFGSSSRSSRSNRSKLVGGRTDYSGMSRDRRREEREERISTRGRRNHLFEEITIETRGEAEQVRDTLLELIDVYDVATVADLYNATDITPEHTDLKYGWTDLTDSRITPARGGGYILELPRAEAL